MRSSSLWFVLLPVVLTACGMTEPTRVSSPTPGEEIQSLMSPDGFDEVAWTLSLGQQGYVDEAMWIDGDLLLIQSRQTAGAVAGDDHAQADCTIHAVDLATGVPRWILTLPRQPSDRPVGGDGLLAFVCGNQAVVVDRETGVRTGASPGYSLPFWASSPPAVSRDTIYVGSYIDSRLETVALETSHTGWHFTADDLVKAAPVLAGTEADRVLVMASERGRVVGLDLRSATAAPPTRPRWMLETGTNEVDPVAAGEIVYLASGDSFLYAINALGGSIVWKYAAGSAFERSLTLAGDTLFACSGGKLLAVDANAGLARWDALGLEQFVVAQPGRVACLTASGNLSMRDADDGHEIVCLSSPVLRHVAVNTSSDLLVFGDGQGQVTAVR